MLLIFLIRDLCALSFFFFKQKTAYEMRISDWSSDVCSSDLLRVVDIEDGEAIAIPDNWDAEDAATPPRLMLKERKPKGGQRIPALRRGDRVLARTEETAHGWIAHPMKKLPARSEGLIDRKSVV